jgi:hypothetical protein
LKDSVCEFLTQDTRLESDKREKAIKIAKEESDKRVTEKMRLVSFRKSLHEGDETNCGPVLVVKPKLVQISFPVANYGNEHWVRRDQILPSGYECSFVNGQYQIPY